MSKKSGRKYQAIQNFEDGIKAYLFINTILDSYEETDHPHAKIAKFIAKATLNELLQTYMEKNGEQALEDFAAKINQGSDGDTNREAAV